MRIDKFLWCVRYFKTRNIATEACKKGYVKINSDNIKPSKIIFNGEKITIRKNQINYDFIILDIPKSRIGAKLVDLYIKDITDKKQFEKLEVLKYSKDYYRKQGTGRPTKKDRRELDNYQDSEWFYEHIQ
mgnify:CR=1 FL=1